jgi:hypothetical protein
VGDHAADGLVEDTGGGAEVEGTCVRLASPGRGASGRACSTHHREWGCTGSPCGGRRGT